MTMACYFLFNFIKRLFLIEKHVWPFCEAQGSLAKAPICIGMAAEVANALPGDTGPPGLGGGPGGDGGNGGDDPDKGKEKAPANAKKNNKPRKIS